MKIIVTGGRYYKDYAMLDDVLNLFPQVSCIIQGGATGADLLAREYAKDNDIKCKTYDAEWDIHGKAAGPIRNRIMLKENKDSIVIAFPGGKGTENCIQEAVKLNMIILRVEK